MSNDPWRIDSKRDVWFVRAVGGRRRRDQLWQHLTAVADIRHRDERKLVV